MFYSAYYGVQRDTSAGITNLRIQRSNFNQSRTSKTIQFRVRRIYREPQVTSPRDKFFWVVQSRERVELLTKSTISLIDRSAGPRASSESWDPLDLEASIWVGCTVGVYDNPEQPLNRWSGVSLNSSQNLHLGLSLNFPFQR